MSARRRAVVLGAGYHGGRRAKDQAVPGAEWGFWWRSGARKMRAAVDCVTDVGWSVSVPVESVAVGFNPMLTLVTGSMCAVIRHANGSDIGVPAPAGTSGILTTIEKLG